MSASQVAEKIREETGEIVAEAIFSDAIDVDVDVDFGMDGDVPGGKFATKIVKNAARTVEWTALITRINFFIDMSTALERFYTVLKERGLIQFSDNLEMGNSVNKREYSSIRGDHVWSVDLPDVECIRAAVPYNTGQDAAIMGQSEGLFHVLMSLVTFCLWCFVLSYKQSRQHGTPIDETLTRDGFTQVYDHLHDTNTTQSGRIMLLGCWTNQKHVLFHFELTDATAGSCCFEKPFTRFMLIQHGPYPAYDPAPDRENIRTFEQLIARNH